MSNSAESLIFVYLVISKYIIDFFGQQKYISRAQREIYKIGQSTIIELVAHKCKYLTKNKIM